MPEIKPTPRNRLLGLVADALTSGRNFADRAQVPAAVPLVGGQGLGTLLLGQAPEEFNEWSYGNMPLRINPLAGRTASFVPEVKPGRKQQLADAMLAIQSVPGGPKMAAGLLGAADMGAGKAMFIGPSAKTWDKAAAAKAVEMERAGADPRAIWSETGTLRGADGQWRQEISDADAVFTSQAKPLTQQDEQAYQQARDLLRGVEQQISDAMKTGKYSLFSLHQKRPELGQAEKQARSVISDYKARLEGRAESELAQALRHPELTQTYPETQSIRLVEDATKRGGSWGSNTIEVGGENKKSTALHELQHAIQQREGFARGGSPEGMRNAPEVADLVRVLEARADAARDAGDKAAYLAATDARARLLRNDGAGAYRLLAGEAEARATQARMNMTPAERRATFPFDSYDVPANQLIVRFGDDTALAIDRDAKNTLIRDLGVGKATAPYRLGDVTPGQANALAGLVNAKPPATADVMVSPQAVTHIYKNRILRDGFTPKQVGDVAEKALMPRSRAAMDPASRNQYPALTNTRVVDPANGRQYDAVAPLIPTDTAFDLVTLVPDGLPAPKKKPRQR